MPWTGRGWGAMSSGHRWGSTCVLYQPPAAGGHLPGWNLSDSPRLALSWPLSVPGIPTMSLAQIASCQLVATPAEQPHQAGPQKRSVPSSGVRGRPGKQTAAIRGHLRPRDPVASRAVTFDPPPPVGEFSLLSVGNNCCACNSIQKNPLDSWDLLLRRGFLMVVAEEEPFLTLGDYKIKLNIILDFIDKNPRLKTGS